MIRLEKLKSAHAARPVSVVPLALPLSVFPVRRRLLRATWPPLLLVALLLLVWEVLVRALDVPAWLLPPPSRVGATLLHDAPLLHTHIASTLTATLYGCVLALLVAPTLAFALDAWEPLRRALYPLLVASQTVPIVAVAPLLIVVFGFGMLPRVLVVALVIFFPITINTIDGLNAVDADQMRLFRALNAGRWQTFWLLRLPAALPALFSGLKISVTYSVIGAVLAEWIGARAGLGVYISRSLRSFRTDQVFVAILVTSLVTMALFGLLVVVEHWLTPWKERST